MQKLKILNSREIKKIKNNLIDHFGCSLSNDYAFLINQKNRVFVINKDVSRIDLNNLRIDKMGLYFAEYKNEQIRLSKEGAQLLVKEGKDKIKNKIELTANEVKEYFKGNDLPKDLGKENKFIIIHYENKILGCAKYKENKIINFLPKIHRGEVIL